MRGLRMTVGLLVLVVLLALPAYAQVNAYVELTRPQCDDQGHYVAVTTQAIVPVMGCVALPSGLATVVVNGVAADVYPTTYRVLNAPDGYTSYGFRVPIYLQPADVINVEVTSDGGYVEDFAYTPATDACINRVLYLRERYRDDYWWDLRLGNCYAFSNQFGLALPWFNVFIERAPRYWCGPFFLGLACRDRDDFVDADLYFRRCLDLDPGFFPAHLERGEMFERRGDWDNARRDYDDARRLRPESAEVNWRLGRTYVNAGDRDHAQQFFNEALQRNPNLAVARYSMGRLLTAEGKTDEAAAQFRQALRTHPNLAPAHADLGNVLMQQGKLPQAEAQYRAAMRGNPQPPDVHLDLGRNLQQQGRQDEALHEFRRAVQVEPNSGEAQHTLSQAEFQRGNYANAWNAVHAAQQNGVKPDAQYLQQLRQKMPEPPKPRLQPRQGTVQPAPRVAPPPAAKQEGGDRGRNRH